MKDLKQGAEQTIASWRAGTGADSPAGPLFTGGRYAESEITMSGRVGTGVCGSNCSGSTTAMCC